MRIVLIFHPFLSNLFIILIEGEKLLKACEMHYNGLLHSIKSKDFASKYCMNECIEKIAFYFFYSS